MAKKEEKFDKRNIRDYNNELEKILENKSFSSEVKNFLLSMFYKIESAYEDYSKTKAYKLLKKDFMAELLEIIKDDCEHIELIKPTSEQAKVLEEKKVECIVNKQNKSILSLYNEKSLLYAIYSIKDSEYKQSDEVVSPALLEFFTIGQAINEKEVIRDFDGWSWNVDKLQIEDIRYNLLYQDMLMLSIVKCTSNLGLKKQLQMACGEKQGKAIYMALCKACVYIYAKKNGEYKKQVLKIKKENEKQLKLMENKIEFLEKIALQKKQLETKIRNIDKYLNNPNELRKEYIRINEKLPDDKKIFSVSDYADELQSQRDILRIDLKKYNEQMAPNNYIKTKTALKEQIDIIGVLSAGNNEYNYIEKVQRLLMGTMVEKVKSADTRKSIMDLIYKLRYYKQLPYNKDNEVNQIETIRPYIEEFEQALYSKACDMKTVTRISINKKANIDVLNAILNTRVIELENLEVNFRAKDYQIVIDVYDNENIDKRINYDTIEGLNVKLSKRFRLFIK